MKMRRLLLLILIILFHLICSEISADITGYHFDDKDIPIEKLWQMADSASVQDPKLGVVYLNMAIQLAEKTHNMELKAISLNRQSSLYLQIGNLDKALEADQKALVIYHVQPGLQGYTDALYNGSIVNKRMIHHLEYDNRMIRKRYIGIFAILLLFITFLYINLYQLKINTNTKLLKANREILHKNEELSNAYQILELVARKDPLTNLSNRRDILDKLKYAQITFERNNHAFSIVMIDVDHFKKINDKYGHDAGDYVLIFLGKLIQKTLRKQDMISRWGGDEFLLLLPDTGITGGVVAAEKIRHSLTTKSCLYGKNRILFTISAGVSSYTKVGEIEACIKAADAAMYASKQNGRDQVTRDQVS